MKAMIFAAGLGTRLGELTKNKPKALVEVHGKPMLEHMVLYLKNSGIRDLIINVHHFGDLIREFLNQQQNFGVKITLSDESNELLDTGGGLMKTVHFFSDYTSFFALNVDVLSKVNLYDVLIQHMENIPLATLVVKKRETSRYFLINDDGLICGWRNKTTGEEILVRPATNLSEVAFSGIQVIDPAIFKLNQLTGKFSLTKMYLELAAQHPIATFEDDSEWFDLGKPENITEAETTFF